jgi:hypothetical protein
MATPTLTVSQILRGADKILRTNGRIVGTFWDTGQERAGTPVSACRVCVNTAITLAAGVNPERFSDPKFGDASPAETQALAAIRAVNLRLGLDASADPVATLYRWHDGYDGDTPTDEQVSAALTGTADVYEQSKAGA